MIVTANLPSRDFDATEAFYGRIGFRRRWRDAGWMILGRGDPAPEAPAAEDRGSGNLGRGDAVIEFFPHPGLVPGDSWFSACIRTGALDALLAEYAALGLPASGIPRLHPGVQRIADDLRMFAVVDPDGSLIRCIGP